MTRFKNVVFVLFFTILIGSGCATNKERNSTSEQVIAIKDRSNEIYMKGVELANRGDIRKALKYFYDAEKTDPKNKTLLRDISLANYQLGKLSTSFEYAEKILLLSEYDYFALMRKAFIYRDVGEADKSIDAFSRVIQYKPDDYIALSNIAQLEFDRKKYKKSFKYIKLFEEAVTDTSPCELMENEKYELKKNKDAMGFIKNVINDK